MAKGETYMKQYAKKFPSELCTSLRKKGYMVANQFRSTTQTKPKKDDGSKEREPNSN